MKSAQAESPDALPSDRLVPLKSILCTKELYRRPARPPDYETENRALGALVQALTDSPLTILQKMAEIMLETFRADSSGISLLTKEDGGKKFYWPAIAGAWKSYIGGGSPREFGPCGDVLDGNAPLLFRHPERRYTYFQAVTPPVEEVLLVPFYVGGKAAGTIWVIAHDDRRKFDAEDLRQMVSLGMFASSAYKTLAVHEKMVAMNQALLLGSVRQHEMTEASETSNEQLQKEIAGRKEAQERLRISEIRYRRLFEVTQDGIVMLDPKTGKITNANPYIFKLFGYTSKQILGKELWEMDLFKDKEAADQALGELKARGFYHGAHLPLLTKGGQLRFVDFFGNLYEENGVEVIQCNIRDITQRKEMEQLLAEKARLIDLSNDAIIVRDLTNKIRLWNRGAEKLFGWTFQEAIGKDLHALLQTEFPKPMEEIIAHLQREGRFNGEVVQITRDGRRVRSLCGWVLDRGTDSIFTSYTDITERTKAEDALHGSEDRFRAFVTASSDVIYRMNADWSEMGELDGRNFIATSEKPSRTWLQDNIPPEDHPQMMAAINEAIQTKSIFQLEHRVRRPDGTFGWTFSRAVPLLDATGKIVEWFGAASDVTEHKLSEEALRASEERYRNLFNSIDQGFCVVEVIFDEREKPVDWRFLEVNPSFGKLTGLSEIVGRRMRELIPDHEEYWFETYGKVALTGEPVRFVNEAKALHRWFDLYAFRIGGQDSRKVAVLFNNITERMVSEEILRHAQAQLANRAGQLEQMVAERTEQLTSSNKQLEAFVYSIAHDLRAPLRSMQGFSAMLVDEEGSTLSEMGRDYAGRINRSARYMDALLQDLLAFSRVAQQQIELTSVNLERVVQSVCSRLEEEIREKKGRVEMAGPWPRVLAHEPTLGQVVTNLVSNALKFVRTDVPPHIRLRAEEGPERIIGSKDQRISPQPINPTIPSSTHPRPGFVRVWVEDNGIGITPDHHQQIFGLFNRLHGDKFPGTGIGLAIVQKGIERMQGNLGLVSTPGQGSRFWFELRKAEEKKD
ncbi:MAG: PAS domain S-box protein [Verrucomicrobiota bacterium]